MGIYKVEIFTPRRVKISKVSRAENKAAADAAADAKSGGAATATGPPPPVTSGTASPASVASPVTTDGKGRTTPRATTPRANEPTTEQQEQQQSPKASPKKTTAADAKEKPKETAVTVNDDDDDAHPPSDGEETTAPASPPNQDIDPEDGEGTDVENEEEQKPKSAGDKIVVVREVEAKELDSPALSRQNSTTEPGQNSFNSRPGTPAAIQVELQVERIKKKHVESSESSSDLSDEDEEDEAGNTTGAEMTTDENGEKKAKGKKKKKSKKSSKKPEPKKQKSGTSPELAPLTKVITAEPPPENAFKRTSSVTFDTAYAALAEGEEKKRLAAAEKKRKEDEEAASSNKSQSPATSPTVKPQNATIDIESELHRVLNECLPQRSSVMWRRCGHYSTVEEAGTELIDDADDDASFLEVHFFAKKKDATRVANRVISEIGIGKDFGHISVMVVEFYRPILQGGRVQTAAEQNLVLTNDQEFVDHVSAQVQFDDLLRSVSEGATFSFDFVLFLIIAAIIAGVGLATGSTVSVVASMLVSPMMGPILGTVLGTVLLCSKERRLQGRSLLLWGFFLEILCLFLCIIVGFIIGLCFWGSTDFYNWGTQGNPEMFGRTQREALLIGVLIAVPSGAGVALSLLGKNGNSLVGVAISASLLPPAVNCGLYCAFAIMREDKELARKGGISFALTAVNVVCIYFSALGAFFLKKAVPQKDIDGRPLNRYFGIDAFDSALAPSQFQDECKDRGLAANFSNNHLESLFFADDSKDDDDDEEEDKGPPGSALLAHDASGIIELYPTTDAEVEAHAKRSPLLPSRSFYAHRGMMPIPHSSSNLLDAGGASPGMRARRRFGAREVVQPKPSWK